MSGAEDAALPRINHVAMSIPKELLAPAEARTLLDFYGEVLGWTEMPGMTKPGELLVFRLHSNEQFVFLPAADEPMRCPALDHFGLSVPRPADLYATYERARKYKERDDRVELIEPKVEDYRVLKLHNFYLRYRLPLMVELQCYEWAPGVGPQSLPDSG